MRKYTTYSLDSDEIKSAIIDWMWEYESVTVESLDISLTTHENGDMYAIVSTVEVTGDD